MGHDTLKEFGKHYLVELIGCSPPCIRHVPQVKESLLRAAKVSEAAVITSFFHQFEPNGVSGIILIATSHFSIHTWPDDNYAAFDVFTCGDLQTELAIEELRRSFQADEAAVKIISRGY